MVNILKNEEFTTMKRLHITREHFEKSKYFTRKYGNLKFVSESGKLFKTDKGHVIKFSESMSNDDAVNVMSAASATDMDAADMGLISHKKADPYNTLKKNKGKKVDEGMKREVVPMNGRASFGHKAVEEEDENGFTLYSYETPVARLERRDDGSGLDFSLLNDYLSATTLTHIHSWLIGHHQKDIPTKKLRELPIGQKVPMVAAESKKLVKEGAGAGYTVTIKNVKLANAKVINRSEDGDWEFEADIVKDSYMVEAEDYYNRFCPISEYDEEWVEVAGRVYGVCWWYEEESDVERQVNGQEQDIGFDYGGGWTHANLPKDGHITADRIRSDEHDTWAIQSIELFAPQVSECVNYCHEHFLDEEEGGEEEEVDESKLAKETSDDLTLDEIYKAVKEEYGGKLFSDNFLKLNIEHVSGQVLCIFELDRPDDMGANDGDDEWWEDKKDSAILFYDELVKFLVDKFGEKFRFTDPRVSDEYSDKSDPKGAFEIFIDEDDATLPIITIDEVADGWYAESEENENGTIDGWRVFDYGEEFPYVERYEVLDPDGYPFFIDHNGGVGSFPEDAIEGTSEEICDELEIEIKDKMYKPRELTEREILDNPVVQKGLKRIKVKFQYEKED